MTKPVTPQEMFDLWQKMVNPGAYPLQSLMFPVLDPKELDKKIAELEVVEHWLRANLNMLQLSIKSLEYQRALLKGGEKAREAMQQAKPGASPEETPNPAMWAWNMMAQAGKQATDAAQEMMKPPPKKSASRRKRKASPG
jgi:hypothetical protein